MSESLIKFRVSPEGGEAYEVEATTRDILTWEKTTKGASYAAFQRGQNMVDLYKVGHLASRRLGMFNGTLKEFEDTCDLEPINDDGDAARDALETLGKFRGELDDDGRAALDTLIAQLAGEDGTDPTKPVP